MMKGKKEAQTKAFTKIFSLPLFLRNLFYFPRPRALAVGERLWSSKETTNLADATGRLWEHRCRYVRYDVITQNYFHYLGTESVPCRLLLRMDKYGHGLKLDKVLLLYLHKSPTKKTYLLHNSKETFRVSDFLKVLLFFFLVGYAILTSTLSRSLRDLWH